MNDFFGSKVHVCFNLLVVVQIFLIQLKSLNGALFSSLIIPTEVEVKIMFTKVKRKLPDYCCYEERFGGNGIYGGLLAVQQIKICNFERMFYGAICIPSIGGPSPPSPPLPSPPLPPLPPTAPPDQKMRFCRSFDNNPALCRDKDCVFVCSDMRCDTKANFKSEVQCNAPTECAQHCFDPCSCKRQDCEYSSVSGACKAGNAHQDCNKTNFIKDYCFRQNAFYSIGGYLCNSQQKSGNCKVDKTIFAVNAGGSAHLGSDGILYQKDIEDFYDDPHSIKEDGKVQTVIDVPDKDKPLYETLVGILNSATGQGKCITYKFQIFQDGSYQLIMKFVEFYYKAKNKRRFNIFLNDLLIVPEVDLFDLVGKDRGVDIILNFEVRNGGQAIIAQGFNQVHSSGEMRLSLCCGNCQRNVDSIGFTLSAFSVVKFKTGNEELNCEAYQNDICECNKMGCLYKSASGECINALKACADVSTEIYKSPFSTCLRENAIFAYGGLLCRNPTDLFANCSAAKTIWAVNVNGQRYKDEKGVEYLGEAEIKKFIDDPNKYRVGGNKRKFCPKIHGASKSDGDSLYSTIAYGKYSKRQPNGCISYPISVCGEGLYEISIKTVDGYWDNENTRRFNVKLNDILVLPEVDVVGINGRCTATEFIILFELDDTFSIIKVLGHTEKAVTDSKLTLKFCYGGCDFIPDPVFQLSAYSVTRLGDVPSSKGKTDDDCNKHNNNPCQCRKNLCEYNAVTKVCMKSSSKEECSSCFFDVLECRRANAWYSEGGVLCKTTTDGGNCLTADIMIALNIGGDSLTDSQGISYHKMDLYNKRYKIHPSSLKISNYDKAEVTPQEDKPLYATYAAPPDGTRNKKCTGYQIPVGDDGNYELSIRLGDFEYDAAGKRTFNIHFNGIQIVEELDILMYTGNKNRVMSLNVNFVVKGDGTLLKMHGYSDGVIQNGQMTLEFCFGSCSTQFEDDKWLVSAFSVVRFVGPGEDSSYVTVEAST